MSVRHKGDKEAVKEMLLTYDLMVELLFKPLKDRG